MSLPPLRLDDLHGRLASFVDESLTLQAPDGAVLEPEWGLPAPMRAAQLCAAVALLPRADDPRAQATRTGGAAAAVDWLRRALRPGNRFDLATTNQDSAPDTAFVVQLLAVAASTIRERGRGDLAELEHSLLALIRTCLDGIATGGFHTPNHRWVICSALAQGQALTGRDSAIDAVVDAYLAEGFDIDDEGAWIERSSGGYDAINDRALLLLADVGRVPAAEAMEPVLRNLWLDVALLNADATIDVALSIRQDHGTTTIPHDLAAIMLWAGHLADDERLRGTAAWIFGHGTPGDSSVIWMTYALGRCQATQILPAAPPDETRVLGSLGTWRHRTGSFSASVTASAHDFLAVRDGTAAIHAIGLHHTHFGPATGRFLADDVELDERGATLRSHGDRDPRRPGYELPLAARVEPTDWERVRTDRDLRRLPRLRSTVTISSLPSGVAIQVTTDEGLEGIPAVVYLDVPEGGIWRSEGVMLEPRAGQTILLRDGYADLIYGRHALRIGPGADAHAMWEPRNLPTHDGVVRILIPLMTPISHHIEIRAVRAIDDHRPLT